MRSSLRHDGANVELRLALYGLPGAKFFTRSIMPNTEAPDAVHVEGIANDVRNSVINLSRSCPCSIDRYSTLRHGVAQYVVTDGFHETLNGFGDAKRSILTVTRLAGYRVVQLWRVPDNRVQEKTREHAFAYFVAFTSRLLRLLRLLPRSSLLLGVLVGPRPRRSCFDGLRSLLLPLSLLETPFPFRSR